MPFIANSPIRVNLDAERDYTGLCRPLPAVECAPNRLVGQLEAVCEGGGGMDAACFFVGAGQVVSDSKILNFSDALKLYE